MKNKLVIIFALALAFVSCENQEISFDDFPTSSVYFPFQTPARTLIQGKYELGFNDNDNKGRFEIGLVMSGVYENTVDRKIGFELAPEIIDAALLGVDTVNVKVLPSSYYTIEQTSPVTIPAGSTKGRIPVQLNDAFFDDPLAFAGEDDVHYVIPLKITNFDDSLDSLLTGVPAVANPIRIRDEDWTDLPKDYTLYGIKFINKYSGIHLRRGEDKVVGTSQSIKTDANGVVIETGALTNYDEAIVYRSEYVVQDELTPITTIGRNKALSTNLVRRPSVIPSNKSVSLELTFNSNEEVTITNADQNSNLTITGTGNFVEDGDEWGGKSRNVIYLEYQYQEQEVEVSEERVFGRLVSTTTTTLNLTHTVKDTLVMRDRNIKFEEFTIDLQKK